jgi:hypothetical protein
MISSSGELTGSLLAARDADCPDNVVAVVRRFNYGVRVRPFLRTLCGGSSSNLPTYYTGQLLSVPRIASVANVSQMLNMPVLFKCFNIPRICRCPILSSHSLEGSATPIKRLFSFCHAYSSAQK